MRLGLQCKNRQHHRMEIERNHWTSGSSTHLTSSQPLVSSPLFSCIVFILSSLVHLSLTPSLFLFFICSLHHFFFSHFYPEPKQPHLIYMCGQAKPAKITDCLPPNLQPMAELHRNHTPKSNFSIAGGQAPLFLSEKSLWGGDSDSWVMSH